jgi:hypothetical protein
MPPFARSVLQDSFGCSEATPAHHGSRKSRGCEPVGFDAVRWGIIEELARRTFVACRSEELLWRLNR